MKTKSRLKKYHSPLKRSRKGGKHSLKRRKQMINYKMVNYKMLNYKNTLLLRKSISIQGKILPRRLTRLTSKKQRYLAKAIKNARIMGFLPFVRGTF